MAFFTNIRFEFSRCLLSRGVMRLGKWFVQPCTKQNCSIDNGWVMHEYDADAYFSLCGKTWLGICWTIHVKHILEIIDCLMARQIPRTNYSNLSQEHFCWAHVKCFRSFSNSFLRTFIIRKNSSYAIITCINYTFSPYSFIFILIVSNFRIIHAAIITCPFHLDFSCTAKVPCVHRSIYEIIQMCDG